MSEKIVCAHLQSGMRVQTQTSAEAAAMVPDALHEGRSLTIRPSSPDGLTIIVNPYWVQAITIQDARGGDDG